jgi:hypothetical protein
MVKEKPQKREPYDKAFEFVSPPTGAYVGTSFTARGKCDYLTKPGLTITVVFTVENFPPRSVAAVLNRDEKTFEAFFENVEMGTGVLMAQAGEYDAPTVYDIHVEGLPSPIGIEITEPSSGRSFPESNGRKDQPRLAPTHTSGSHGVDRQVFAYVTRGGKKLRGDVDISSNSGSGGLGRPFRRSLASLFPNPSAPSDKFGLHFLVKKRGSTREWTVSRGYFTFGRSARQAASRLKSKPGKSMKRPAGKPARPKTSKRKTVKKRK